MEKDFETKFRLTKDYANALSRDDKYADRSERIDTIIDCIGHLESQVSDQDITYDNAITQLNSYYIALEKIEQGVQEEIDKSTKLDLDPDIKKDVQPSVVSPKTAQKVETQRAEAEVTEKHNSVEQKQSAPKARGEQSKKNILQRFRASFKFNLDKIFSRKQAPVAPKQKS